jgi:hypothetical protein
MIQLSLTPLRPKHLETPKTKLSSQKMSPLRLIHSHHRLVHNTLETPPGGTRWPNIAISMDRRMNVCPGRATSYRNATRKQSIPRIMNSRRKRSRRCTLNLGGGIPNGPHGLESVRFNPLDIACSSLTRFRIVSPSHAIVSSLPHHFLWN